MFGIPLGKDERLGDRPVGPDMGEIRLAVKPVVALGGPADPSPAAAPAVIGVGIFAIDCLERGQFAAGDFIEPQIGLGMPDGESSVVGNGQENVLPIGRAFRETDGFAQGRLLSKSWAAFLGA